MNEPLFPPKTIGALRDRLGSMVLRCPTFQREHEKILYPGRDIHHIYLELKESLNLLRGKLGEEKFRRLNEMAERTKELFLADEEDKNGKTREGRFLLQDMEELL